MPKFAADTSAWTAQTVVEPSCCCLAPGVYHHPPESDWFLAITPTALPTTPRTFATSRSGLVLQNSDRPYASDRASVANPWPWIHEWPCVAKVPSVWLAMRKPRARVRARPWSPANGSSEADRYARQPKLVTARVYCLPQEPSLAWFLVSQSRPRSRAARVALSGCGAGLSCPAAGAARKSPRTSVVRRAIVTSSVGVRER